MNLKEFKKYLQETIEKNLDKRLEDLEKESQARIKEAEAQKEAQRQHTAALGFANTPEDYKSKARHVIKNDPYEGAGLRFGRYVRALAAGKQLGKHPAEIAEKWGDEWLKKSLTSQDFTGAGALVPDEFRREVIELLRAQSVMRQMGARQMPLRGSMTIPRQSASATASYVGETANITPTQLTVEQIQLSPKKLAALTPVSNDLLAESDPAADQLVRDDLVQVMRLREDIAFIRDDGTQNKPKGLLNSLATANKFNRNPTLNAENVTNDLFKAVRLVRAANVPVIRPGWIMTTRTQFYLMSLRLGASGDGQYAFRDELAAGTLLGFPVFIENQIPENLGGGSDESEVYFVEASEMIIADSMDLNIQVFPGGAFYDGANVVSGISTDQTVIRAMSKHDFALKHPLGASVIEQIDWI